MVVKKEVVGEGGGLGVLVEIGKKKRQRERRLQFSYQIKMGADHEEKSGL